MIFPKLSSGEKKKSFIQAFKGINFGTRIGEDEFADTLNFTSDEYPVLATRKKRAEASYVNDDENYTGYFCGFQGDGTRFAQVTYNNGDKAMLYVYDKSLGLDHYFTIDLDSNTKERQILFFGAYVLIYPDNCYINLLQAKEDMEYVKSMEQPPYNGNYYDNYKPKDKSNATFRRKANADSGKIRNEALAFTVENWYAYDASNPLLGYVVEDAFVLSEYEWSDKEENFPINTMLMMAYPVNEYFFGEPKPKYYKLDRIGFWDKTNHFGIGAFNDLFNTFIYGRSYLKISVDNTSTILLGNNNFDSVGFLGDDVYQGDGYILIKGAIPFRKIERKDGKFIVTHFKGEKDVNGGDVTVGDPYQAFKNFNHSDVIEATVFSDSTITYPILDHRVVCQNRLWGCRCGENAEGKTVNEIYCTALGTFDSFEVHDGIASDSWSVPVGSPGMFTGAAVIGQNPIFFKENSVIKVYVSASGAHQVVETNMRGVQLDSHKSIVYMNEMLVYKACDGVVVYGGTSVTPIFNALADRYYCNAVAGGYGSKYVMYCEDKDGNGYIFVYDFKYGIWHRESLHKAPGLIERGTVPKIIDITTDGNRVLLAAGNGHIIYDGEKRGGGLGVTEAPFPYLLETGDIGFSTADSKEISRIDLRYSLGIGSIVRVYVKYDSEEWVNVYSAEGQKAAPGTVSLPIIPRLCDHFRIRVSGVGEFKLYGIAKEYREISN